MSNMAETTHRVRRRAVWPRVALIAALMAVVLIAAGFVMFVRNLAMAEAPLSAPADGIVVLTGAPARIEGAMDLLADKKARRLLITGVNADISTTSLRARHSRYGALFDCCVDLDRKALDTAGNAREAAAWAARHKFTSVVLVTSSYHMPRSHLEFRAASPRTHVVPFPVIAQRVHIERWWAYPGTFRLLCSEYFKYLAALARTGIFRGSRAGSSG